MNEHGVWWVCAGLVLAASLTVRADEPAPSTPEGLPGAPALPAASTVDRGGWRWKVQGPAPDLLLSGDAVVPGPFRRVMSDRYSRAVGPGLRKGALLEAVARPDADTFDLVFLGDAYSQGLYYSGRDVAGFSRGIAGDLHAGVLGSLHSLGRDPERAEQWYRAAAARTPTNTLALVRLADHLLRERPGDARAEGEADELYQRAAAAGDAEASRKLALRLRARDASDPRWRGLLQRAAFPAPHPEEYLDRIARAHVILLDLDEGRFEQAHQRYWGIRALDERLLRKLEWESALEDQASRRLAKWLEERGEAGDGAAFYALYQLRRLRAVVLRRAVEFLCRADRPDAARELLPLLEPIAVPAERQAAREEIAKAEERLELRHHPGADIARIGTPGRERARGRTDQGAPHRPDGWVTSRSPPRRAATTAPSGSTPT